MNERMGLQECEDPMDFDAAGGVVGVVDVPLAHLQALPSRDGFTSVNVSVFGWYFFECIFPDHTTAKRTTRR